jgi:hypothetical protein
MHTLENLTEFALTCLPSMSLDGQALAVLIVAGTYALPAPGASKAHAILLDDQPEVPLAPTHHGVPGSSSLIWEGQAIPGRPGTDIYVDALAWAPRGRPATSTTVALRLGPVSRDAIVFGDRHWRVAGLASAPEPFVSLPLIYERCFGGFIEGARGATAAAAEHNPIGRGLYESMAAARSMPLPNIESPDALVSSPSDRPAPRGFGPVMAGWMPRRALAGTYDARWVKQRAPLWPEDIDPVFFVAAAPGLHVAACLQGGETLVLHGMHPDGDILCELPRERLVAKFMLSDRRPRVVPVLDAIMISARTMTFTLIWRASLPTIPSFFELEAAVVRHLETWEPPP